MTINTGSWLTAMAVDSLAYYFPESVREGMVKWMDNLRKPPTSIRLTADKGADVVFMKNMLLRLLCDLHYHMIVQYHTLLNCCTQPFFFIRANVGCNAAVHDN